MTCSWKTKHFNSSSQALGTTHVEMKICSLYKPTLGASQPLRQRSQQRRQKDSTGPTEREAGKRAISRLAGEGRSRGGDSWSPLGHGPRGSGQAQRVGQLNRARQASSMDSKAVGAAARHAASVKKWTTSPGLTGPRRPSRHEIWNCWGQWRSRGQDFLHYSFGFKNHRILNISKSFLKFSTFTLDLISLFFNLGFSYDRMLLLKMCHGLLLLLLAICLMFWYYFLFIIKNSKVFIKKRVPNQSYAQVETKLQISHFMI